MIIKGLEKTGRLSLARQFEKYIIEEPLDITSLGLEWGSLK